MKLKSILWLCFVAFTSNLIAQTPNLINYQAIVRDVNNSVITNQSVSIKFVITEGLPNGLVIYEENQSATTNSHGLINIKIGAGLLVIGTLDGIDWSANSYYLTTSIDPTGAANYTLSGISELVSVPYALHAKTVDNADDADADPANEIQDLQLFGNDLSITNNGSATVIDLSSFAVDNNTQLNEAQVDAFVANNGFISTEVDGSITNEIQSISVTGSTATLSNGGGSISINDADSDATNEIELPTGGTNGQVLRTNGSGAYTWVNQADDADADPTNEIELPAGGTNGQVLRTNGSGAYTWVNQADDADADPTNEIELPAGGTNGQVLRTNGSGAYTWVNQTTGVQLTEAEVDAYTNNNGYLLTEVDGSITNEIELPVGGVNGQVLSTNGSGVYTWVSTGGTQLTEAQVDAYVANNGYLTTEVDGSTTNEIQTLSISGSDLTISGPGGNTVTLPSASGPTFAVGMHHQGGIIVFVDSTGLHGLIASLDDLSTGTAFENSTNTNLPAAQSYIDGSANTAAMVASASAFDAANLCDAYSAGGFTDWYLPSFAETQLIFQNAYVMLNLSLGNIYWTSTQAPGSIGFSAISYYGSGGSNPSSSPGTAFFIRAMRQF